MKQRKVYYSRKAGKIIAEGKRNNKTIYLFSVPSILKMLNSSLFTEEKRAKIMAKIQSLDVREIKPKKSSEKVPTINIVRTQENNDFKLVFDTKEEMENFLKNPPRVLTEEEIEEIYNKGEKLK